MEARDYWETDSTKSPSGVRKQSPGEVWQRSTEIFFVYNDGDTYIYRPNASLAIGLFEAWRNRCRVTVVSAGHQYQSGAEWCMGFISCEWRVWCYQCKCRYHVPWSPRHYTKQ